MRHTIYTENFEQCVCIVTREYGAVAIYFTNLDNNIRVATFNSQGHISFFKSSIQHSSTSKYFYEVDGNVMVYFSDDGCIHTSTDLLTWVLSYGHESDGDVKSDILASVPELSYRHVISQNGVVSFADMGSVRNNEITMTTDFPTFGRVAVDGYVTRHSLIIQNMGVGYKGSGYMVCDAVFEFKDCVIGFHELRILGHGKHCMFRFNKLTGDNVSIDNETRAYVKCGDILYIYKNDGSVITTTDGYKFTKAKNKCNFSFAPSQSFVAHRGRIYCINLHSEQKITVSADGVIFNARGGQVGVLDSYMESDPANDDTRPRTVCDNRGNLLILDKRDKLQTVNLNGG